MIDAFSSVPCGCSEHLDALEEPDEEIRACRLELAEEHKRCWNCPNAAPESSSSPPSSSALPAEAQEVLIAVEQLTGASRQVFDTCPLYYLRDNTETGQAVNRAVRAREFFNKGQLALVEGTNPSLALIEAVEAIESSVKRCERYIFKKEQERIQRKREQAESRSKNI